ncbi:MAG: hypothetical protein ACREQY_09865 [Candidatus Binatia bacterium]
MSIRRTAVLAAAFAILAVYFLVFEGVSVERPAPEWERGERILSCPAGGLSELHVSGPRGELRAERFGEGWKVVPKPELEQIAGAAVESLAASLCDLPVIDTIHDFSSLADFGLEAAPIEIRAAGGHWKGALFIGELTPARNLLYARREDGSQVLKVGALLRSEVDKVLAYAAPKSEGAS